MKKPIKRHVLSTSFALLPDQIKFIKKLADKKEVSTSRIVRDLINEKMELK